MRRGFLLCLVLLPLLVGCGPEVWIVERELGRSSDTKEVVAIEPRIDPLLGPSDVRRFSVGVERILLVRGRREIEVVRVERPFNPFYEAGETLIGVVATPFYVVLFPAIYPLTVGIHADQASIAKYFAVIPERFLNPTRNDLFQEDVSETVVEIRAEPFEDRQAEDVPPDEAIGLDLTLVELSARPRGGHGGNVPVSGARLIEGTTLEFERPVLPVDEYVLRLSIGGVERTVRFQDY